MNDFFLFFFFFLDISRIFYNPHAIVIVSCASYKTHLRECASHLSMCCARDIVNYVANGYINKDLTIWERETGLFVIRGLINVGLSRLINGDGKFVTRWYFVRLNECLFM